MSSSSNKPSLCRSATLHIVLLESFEGSDTFVRCGDEYQQHLYCVVAINESEQAEIIDSGYRTVEEAAQAWSKAVRPM